MAVRPRFVLCLLVRDMNEIGLIIGSFAVVFSIALLVGASRNPHYPATANGIVLSGSVCMVAMMQFVQALILKEKASGAFLFLRSLPVTSDEIATSKVAAVCAGTEIVYLLLLTANYVFLSIRSIAFQPLTGWVTLWTAGILLLMATTSAGAALAYDQKRAMLVPFLTIAVLVLLVVGISQVSGPRFWPEFFRWRAEQWGLLILALLVWGSMRVGVALFRRRDFVQLVE